LEAGVTTSVGGNGLADRTMGWRRRASGVALPLLIGASISWGCAHKLARDKCPQVIAAGSDHSSAVEIRYLGTGGYLVRRGADVVLFGPVYSNPTALEVFFDHEIRTDNRLVEALLPAEADGAQAIVVGHSHYDHLMDAPYIALRRARGANIYGSVVTQHLLRETWEELRKRVPPNEVIALDQKAAAREWEVLPGKRMRLLAIPSEHSDQFRLDAFGLKWAAHAWRGDIYEPRARLPRSASEWAEGATFSYLLDFLDAPGGEPVFRVYYQDSGTHEPVGYVPKRSPNDDEPWDGKPVDVALICGGGDFERLRRHPEGIVLNSRPRHVIIGHWEDFFVTQRAICTENAIRGLPLSDTKQFLKRARKAHRAATGRESVFLPCPTASVFQIPIDPAGQPAVTKTTFDCTTIP
jgi:hypothetical protein